MIRLAGFLLVGIVFGYTLSRSGASDYNYIYYLFTGQDFRIVLLIGTAVITGAIGMIVLKKLGNKDVHGREISIRVKSPIYASILIGGILFGLGWAMTGACPGTAVAQVGEGKVLGMFTFLGIAFGTLVYAKTGTRK